MHNSVRAKFVAIVLCAVAIGCSGRTSNSLQNGTSEHLGAWSETEMVDRVPLVLRVEAVKRLGGSKYNWTAVNVAAVLKNFTNESIGEKMDIASLGTGPGIPSGTCTVYLVRYNATEHELGWKLNETEEQPVAYSHHIE